MHRVRRPRSAGADGAASFALRSLPGMLCYLRVATRLLPVPRPARRWRIDIDAGELRPEALTTPATLGGSPLNTGWRQTPSHASFRHEWLRSIAANLSRSRSIRAGVNPPTRLPAIEENSEPKGRFGQLQIVRRDELPTGCSASLFLAQKIPPTTGSRAGSTETNSATASLGSWR